jgi:type I restriction enzyme, S subunit
VRVQTLQLGDIVLSADPGFASGENPASGVVQLRMNNVSTCGAIDWSEIRRVPADRRKAERYALAPGDVVFNNTNSPYLVGKTALFTGFKEPAVFSNHFLRIRIDRKAADPGYVARWLSFQWKRRTFENLCTRWVNQASVRKDDLLGLQISLPELPEQRRIAGQLQQADRLVRARRYALELTDTFLPAVFRQLFGSRLKSGPFREFGELVEITGGGTPARERPEFYRGRIPWLTSKDMKGDYIWDTEEHIQRRPFRKARQISFLPNPSLSSCRAKCLCIGCRSPSPRFRFATGRTSNRSSALRRFNWHSPDSSSNFTQGGF